MMDDGNSIICFSFFFLRLPLAMLCHVWLARQYPGCSDGTLVLLENVSITCQVMWFSLEKNPANAPYIHTPFSCDRPTNAIGNSPSFSLSASVFSGCQFITQQEWVVLSTPGTKCIWCLNQNFSLLLVYLIIDSWSFQPFISEYKLLNVSEYPPWARSSDLS